MHKKGIRILTHLAIGALSLVVAVLAGEMVVRSLAPQVTLFPRYVTSSQYPIEFPPNARLVHSRGRLWRFDYSTNSTGRRGAYVPLAASRERCTVVVLGDSFTFGIGVNDEAVYSQVLATLLGPDFAVVNGGMSGWGLDSEVKWYQVTGRQYQPRFVVLQFTANDPADYAGVASIEDDSLVLRPFRSSKSLLQQIISSSRVIQTSHLYSLARNAFVASSSDRDRSAMGESDSVSQVASVRRQANYAQMLQLFSHHLNERGVRLLFISVTHMDLATTSYVYDLERFPVIRDIVLYLDSTEQLTFVKMPLDQMAGYPTSVEGHQWGERHHAAVGAQIADAILTARCADPGSLEGNQ